ncbi:hypothetical protein [Thermococcus sp. LS2]|uniref:hypothetical protein n=1 Tax=Thermococcus sp. LS2 TaxID=1638260 RepID=UPI00143BD17E|nr:hypothetical protein [Thermococcus sp. LS2]NJE12002.1 hypothetical protein [Thermococcus sp. LS2]
MNLSKIGQFLLTVADILEIPAEIPLIIKGDKMVISNAFVKTIRIDDKNVPLALVEWYRGRELAGIEIYLRDAHKYSNYFDFLVGEALNLLAEFRSVKLLELQRNNKSVNVKAFAKEGRFFQNSKLIMETDLTLEGVIELGSQELFGTFKHLKAITKDGKSYIFDFDNRTHARSESS